jgi:stage II sporulation protein D
LLEVLGQTLHAHTGRAMQVSRVSGVEQVDSNAAGRATVRLTADGQDHVLRSDSVRWVLRPPPGTAILNSSRISDIDAAYEGGEVETLTIHGGGWGHGIGMCQVGAMGRARAGHSYEQILTTYYSGTELQRLY